MKKACITGGTGFVGVTLAQALLPSQFHIVLLDCTLAGRQLPDGVTFAHVDLSNPTCEQALEIAFRGADVVFHIASYGMSGAAQLDNKRVNAINVEGTKRVLRAAVLASVPKLVYTSTYNVVFGGQSISAGNESLPYFPLWRHKDEYSRSKARAESAVLAANGTVLPDNKGVLRTCALRPAAIWGPGESRHQPRVVADAHRGVLCFVFGRADALMDFVHVRNLVKAQILAAEALDGEMVAAGQAYFVNDGEDKACNTFTFFGGLLEGLGYRMPTLRLPLWFVYYVAFMMEILHILFARLLPFEPPLTRAECLKAGVNHWFVIEKARRDLGYKPEEYSIDEVVQWFKARGLHAGSTFNAQCAIGEQRRRGVPTSLYTAWVVVAVGLVAIVFVVTRVMDMPGGRNVAELVN
jgi:nucleoside-diphosphate-sugar epimerase